jgi:23S rRNA (uracil1939-C5)-methyltransferase
VNHVVSLVPAGPVVDLYAGVGLFGLALASLGQRPVTLVEGDPVTGADLRHNAEAHAGVRVAVQGVERYLASTSTPGGATFLLDPPRTGLSTAALTSVVATRPARVVYVSCDVATLARDARVLIDAGFAMTGVRAFDLFPNTAHIETVATFDAGSS